MLSLCCLLDAYSDKELREAEETVLHHLNYCTMYLLSEQHVAIMLRVSLKSLYVLLSSIITLLAELSPHAGCHIDALYAQRHHLNDSR